MTKPGDNLRVPLTATYRNSQLRAPIASFKYKEQGTAKESRSPRNLRRENLSADLRAWMDGAADGDTIDVVVEISPEDAWLCSPRRPLPARPTASDPLLAAELEQASGGGFRNPYTFVPALEREFLPAPFADAPPPGHARYDPDTQWAGTLRVRLTTLTPLLLPDTAEAGRAGPEPPPGQQSGRDPRSKLFDVRVGCDGKPMIHGTALKGTLRSAYEMITASRFGVFHGHDLRLAYRRPAAASLGLLPARVEIGPDGIAVFRLCLGDDAWCAGEPVPAAWVPVYRGRQTDFRTGAGMYANLNASQVAALHGAFVAARVRLFEHGRPRFLVWRATHIAPDQAALKEHPAVDPATDHDNGNLTLVPGVGARVVTGWLSITGRTIDRKHDERLFVRTPSDPVRPVEPEHRELWRSVLHAYEAAAEQHDPPEGVQRSWHVGRYRELEPMPDGTLVYLEVDGGDPIGGRIKGVHPVMIGRDVFPRSPGSRLAPSLRPARSLDELSAADRVFGWVPPSRTEDGGQGGYRGRISFGPVEMTGCGPDGWAQELGGQDQQGVELAPLSSPKPTQFRFYGSPDRSGAVFPSKTPKSEGYGPTTGLRGRKAYWWPLAGEGYWQPGGPPLADGRQREYLNTGGAKPSQVGRHRRWVRPQTVFEVSVRVDGLTAGELGALVWLLTLPDGHALRLGGGKPLGFGAVHAQLVNPGGATGTGAADQTLVWTGDALRACWTQLQRPSPVPFERLRELAEEFAAVAAGDPVLGPAVNGFLAVSRGTDQPVHYPRTSPAPETESYRWFVANERTGNGEVGRGFALPLVDDDEGGLLPYMGPQDRR